MLAVWLLAACNTAPTVSWTARFDDATLEDRATRVVAVVERGGCGGEAIYEAASDATAPEPPELEEGRYGFRAYAIDGGCVRFAEVCVERELPLDDEAPIVLVLVAVDEAPSCGAGCACSCASDQCTAGRCAPARPVELVAGGDDHTCAIVEGELYCWGSGIEGRLGVPTPRSTTPIRVGTDSDWADVKLGHNHACAIKDDGSLYCWGSNGAGQTGLGSAGSIDRPTRVGDANDWSGIATGAFSTCGLRGSDLYCFGGNDTGQLGLGDTMNRNMPARAMLSNVVEVGLGADHACVLVGAGELYCYGDNAAGMVTGPLPDPPAPILVPRRVDGVWDSVLSTANISCARRGAELFCWGANGEGQLATGDRTHRRTPASLGAIEFFSSGLGRHACTLAEGRRACFGNNEEGAVGIDTFGNDVLVPTSLTGETIRWRTIATGYRHTCGIDLGGALYCWGHNDDGQIGDGTVGAPVLVPARVCVP